MKRKTIRKGQNDYHINYNDLNEVIQAPPLPAV